MEGLECSLSTCVEPLPPTGSGVSSDICVLNSDCAPGFYCSGIFCTAQVALGDSCQLGSVCADGLSCIAGICDITPEPGIVGDFCLPDLPCEDGLICDSF